MSVVDDIKQKVDMRVTLGNIITLGFMAVGGLWVIAELQSVVRVMEERVSKLESQVVEANRRITITDRDAASASDKTNAKFEGFARDLSDVKISVRGIETAVQFLVNQSRAKQD